MTAALGRFLILASVLVSTCGAFVAFAAGKKQSLEGLRWARRSAYAFAALLVLATLTMEYALLTHDFSVSYVAQVGSRQVPVWAGFQLGESALGIVALGDDGSDPAPRPPNDGEHRSSLRAALAHALHVLRKARPPALGIRLISSPGSAKWSGPLIRRGWPRPDLPGCRGRC